MADCSNTPTPESTANFDLDSRCFSEVMTSNADYTTSKASDGNSKKTIASSLRDAGWVSVGEWSTNPTLTKPSEYVYLNNQRFAPVNLPYTVDSVANPDPQVLVDSGALRDVSSFLNTYQLYSELASQIGLNYTEDWHPGINIPSGGMLSKIAIRHNDQLYSVGVDTGFVSNNFEHDLDAGRFISRAFLDVSKTINSSHVINKNQIYFGFPAETKTVEEILNYRDNYNYSFDDTASGSLTSDIDIIKGRLKYVSFRIPPVTVNDSQTSATSTLAGRGSFNSFDITGKSTGEFNYTIYTTSGLDFSANAKSLSQGDIDTPFTFVSQDSFNFLRVKKGIGQGKIGIMYQYNNPIDPITRNTVMVEVINLDDGRSVRDYDLIMPKISSMTMDGAFGLVDSKELSYVIKCVSGTVNIEGAGYKLGDSSLIEVASGTIENLPSTGYFSIPKVYSRKAISISVNIQQKNPGTQSEVTELKIFGGR